LTQISEEFRQFIVENFLFGRSHPFSDDDSLIETGIIDSTGILEMIAFLEKKYGIAVEESEMVPENLDSIRRLTEFAGRKIKLPA
jgi:acyl carrier protein